jgi:hypothetical protein
MLVPREDAHPGLVSEKYVIAVMDSLEDPTAQYCCRRQKPKIAGQHYPSPRQQDYGCRLWL